MKAESAPLSANGKSIGRTSIARSSAESWQIRSLAALSATFNPNPGSAMMAASDALTIESASLSPTTTWHRSAGTKDKATSSVFARKRAQTILRARGARMGDRRDFPSARDLHGTMMCKVMTTAVLPRRVRAQTRYRLRRARADLPASASGSVPNRPSSPLLRLPAGAPRPPYR